MYPMCAILSSSSFQRRAHRPDRFGTPLLFMLRPIGLALRGGLLLPAGSPTLLLWRTGHFTSRDAVRVLLKYGREEQPVASRTLISGATVITMDEKLGD